MNRFKLSGLGLRRAALAAGILALAIYSGPSPRTSRGAGTMPPELRSLMAAYGADAVTLDRNAREFKMPDQVEWKGRPGNSNQTAMLLGDSTKPGLYVQLLKRGPDDWSQPHMHPNERFITVLAGSFLIGTGAKLDRANTVAIKPGGFVHDIANQMHYDGTGPEGATIEIVGIGPTARTEAGGN